MTVPPGPTPPGAFKRWIPPIALGAVALAAAVEAFTFRTYFPADPLGPRAFPWVGIALLALGVTALTRDRAIAQDWPPEDAQRRILGAILALGAYALLIGSAGFVLSTSAAFVALALLFGARIVGSSLVGLVFALTLWVAFVYGLGLPLPVGTWFS